MAREPDLKTYFWWQKVANDHPGGVMPKADAARMLGLAHQSIEYRTYTGQIRTLVCPSGREWLVTADVLRLLSDLACELLSAKPQINTKNPEKSNIPSVQELISSAPH